MFSNYLKIAWRNLLRNRMFSVINILGLTLGLTCFLLITLFVLSQFQYDKHHDNAPQLYRVETELIRDGDSWVSATVSPPIVPMMQNDFPEVVMASRVVDPPETSHHVLKWQENSFFETKGYYVDSTYFSMFSYDWIEGEPEVALMEPYTLVITTEVKEKLFNEEAAMGKVIQISNRFGTNDFKVTGVVNQSTYKSHIRPNFYMSMNSGGIGEYVRNNNQWSGGNFIHGYVLLHPTANPSELLKKVPDFLTRHGGNQFAESGSAKILSLQPVSDIHLYSGRNNQLDTTGNARFLAILMLIAGFVLVIACVNFMNLATAKSIQRGMEVGIRKTIGASRMNIARQFYFESFLVAGISFVLAIIIASYSLPFVAHFVQEEISWQSSGLLPISLGLIGLYILTGLLTGSYPAIFLSSFKPISIIKGSETHKNHQDILRKSLVVLQFTISLGLIIGSMVILNQLRFMLGQDVGFDAQHKIVIPFRTDDARSKLGIFKNETLNMPGTNGAAGARIYPGQFMPQDFNVYKEGGNMQTASNVHLIQGDEDYLPTLGVQILHGRNFSQRDTSLQILVNQTTLRTFDIPEAEAVGQRLFSGYQDQRSSFEIIGVVKDYHQVSLKESIVPIIFEYRPTGRNLALIVDAALSESQTLVAAMQSRWQELIPETPFEFLYLDDHLVAQYGQEERLAKIISLFTLLTIFISCLGLFGLATFMAERRTKEIGIRKVLGARVEGIIALLSKDFLKLILIAFLIASPLAYYFMEKWLQHFVYRIDLSIWDFAFAGILLAVLALITISTQSVKAALANPVNSLRNE